MIIRTMKLPKFYNKQLLKRSFTRNSTGLTLTTPTAEKYPWIEQTDPNGSGLTYYWNTKTNETTHLGSGRPQHWIEVEDPNGSSSYYWWNPETNQTTPLNSPRPSLFPLPPTSNTTSIRTYGVIRPVISDNSIDAYQRQQQVPVQQQSFGKTMIVYATFGAGITFAMVAVRALFGF